VSQASERGYLVKGSMEYEDLNASDRGIVERQLNRRLRGDVMVAARCPYGIVEAIATSPLLPDGTPFPTLFWLTCPLFIRHVSRLESGEFREVLRRRLRDQPGFADALKRAERQYVMERESWADRLGGADRLRGHFTGREGVGGTVAGGLKCLHAHLAHFLAGGDNPVGAEIARMLDGIQISECGGDCEPFLRKDGRR
jgi:hypothetical protein